MASKAQRRLIVALDFDRLSPAISIARELADLVGMFKIGKQLFTSAGPRAVEQVAGTGTGIFLDLKFHDIPNTVAGAARAASLLPGVKLVNVHALGGSAMLAAAVGALRPLKRRPKLLAVTILTSMSDAGIREVGIAGPLSAQVVKLARLAQKIGIDGVISSPREVRAIRRACGRDFLIVVPSVRPSWAAKNDQSRTATPREALEAGADYIVVGRPITAAKDPRAATLAVLEEMSLVRRRV